MMCVWVRYKEDEFGQVVFSGSLPECRQFIQNEDKQMYDQIGICQEDGTIYEQIK